MKSSTAVSPYHVYVGAYTYLRLIITEEWTRSEVAGGHVAEYLRR